MDILKAKSYKLKAHTRVAAGQAALSTILIIGGIIMLFGISIALITISFTNSTLGFQASNRALAIAMGGIRDAELQLLRNPSFSDAGYCMPAANTPCPSSSTLVIVLQNTPSTGQVTVTSDASIQRRRRKVSAVYVISATTTELTPQSLTVLTQ